MSNKLIRRDLTVPENHQNAAVHLAANQIADFFQQDGNAIKHRAILPDGSVADITGNIGAEISEMLIRPGSTSEYEIVYVGPTRTFTSLATTLDYMKTKNSGSKGFDVLLDPGTYAAVTFTLMNIRVRSADVDNPAVVEGDLTFEYCPKARVTSLNINGSLRFFDGTNGFASGVHISNPTSHGLQVYRNSYCSIVHSSISRSELNASSFGISVIHSSFVSIHDLAISNFGTGIYASASASVMVESGLPKSIIDGCTMGITAVGASQVRGDNSNLSITNTTTVSTPTINTVGNYNSYIIRY